MILPTHGVSAAIGARICQIPVRIVNTRAFPLTKGFSLWYSDRKRIAKYGNGTEQPGV